MDHFSGPHKSWIKKLWLVKLDSLENELDLQEQPYDSFVSKEKMNRGEDSLKKHFSQQRTLPDGHQTIRRFSQVILGL